MTDPNEMEELRRKHSIGDVIREALETLSIFSTSDVANEVNDKLWNDYLLFGEEPLERLLKKASCEGIRRQVVQITKQERVTGESTSVPKFIGIDSKGGDRPNQQALWKRAPWDHLDAATTRIEKQGGRLASVAHVYRQALKLRDLYPNTNNFEEACALAGIDPDEFNIDVELHEAI